MKIDLKGLPLALAGVCFCGTLLPGCGEKVAENTNNAGKIAENQPAGTTRGAEINSATASPPAAGGMGDPVDTVKFDAEINRLEKLAQKNPGDETGRRALANAYLVRANALTGARQYRAALGDYRHVLRYDPDNEEAQQMAATIINIMKTMGREVPAEGEEPAPLQVTPETMPDDAAGPSAATQANANQRSSN